MTLPTIPCPECGIPNDGQYSPEHPDSLPQEGDLSICLYCGYMAVFTGKDEGLSLRLITDEERVLAMEQDEVVQALAFIRRVRG